MTCIFRHLVVIVTGCIFLCCLLHTLKRNNSLQIKKEECDKQQSRYYDIAYKYRIHILHCLWMQRVYRQWQYDIKADVKSWCDGIYNTEWSVWQQIVSISAVYRLLWEQRGIILIDIIAFFIFLHIWINDYFSVSFTYPNAYSGCIVYCTELFSDRCYRTFNQICIGKILWFYLLCFVVYTCLSIIK